MSAEQKYRRQSPDLRERQHSEARPGEALEASGGLFRVVEVQGGEIQVEERPEMPSMPAPTVERVSGTVGDRLFFLAEKQPDGTYSIALTEEGVQTFETALGIADDLGGKTRISPLSTIADIMERTATREELSQLLRREGDGMLYRVRIAILRRLLRGSENPPAPQRAIGHLGKAVIVAIVGIWTLLQFGTAVQDIADIPGILANIPSDIVNLHPTSAFSEVGNRISDAGQHVLMGVMGALFTYVVAKLIQPFSRIYRNDQIIPGERLFLRGINGMARRAEERSHRRSLKARLE